jgi:hypothetical protein
MNFGAVLLSLAAFAIVLALMHVMTKIDNRRDSTARHKRIRAELFSGDTITHLGRR